MKPLNVDILNEHLDRTDSTVGDVSLVTLTTKYTGNLAFVIFTEPVIITHVKHFQFGKLSHRGVSDLVPQDESNHLSRDDVADLIAQAGWVQMIENHLPYVDLAFNIYCFYRDIGGFEASFCLSTVAMATLRFLKCYYSFTDAFHLLRVFLEFDFSSNELEPQGFISSSRQFLDTLKSTTSCDLSHKFKRLVKSVLTCSLTKQFALENTPEKVLEYVDAKVMNLSSTPLELFQDLAEFVTTFAESGYEFFTTGDLRALLCANRAVRDFLSDHSRLEKELAICGTDVTSDPNEYLVRLDNLIARGNTLCIHHAPLIRPFVKMSLDWRTKFVREAAISSFRKPPFSILLYGPPGIGKSTLTQLLGTLYHRTVTSNKFRETDSQVMYPDLTWDPKKNVYTRNFSEDFYSGFKGARHWLIVLDDLARETRKQIAAGLAPSLAEVLTINNTVGITTNQAALEDKGCVPMLPKLLIGSTNQKDLNASFALNDSSALLRRFPLVIEPVLKPEYLDKDTGMMKKVDKKLEDPWTFKIDVYKMRRDQYGKTVGDYIPQFPVPGNERREFTMAEMNIFVHNKILEHERNSHVMFESMHVPDTVTTCKHGVLSTFKCQLCIEAEIEPIDDEPLEKQSFVSSALGTVDSVFDYTIYVPVKAAINHFCMPPLTYIRDKIWPPHKCPQRMSFLPEIPPLPPVWKAQACASILLWARFLPTGMYNALFAYLLGTKSLREYTRDYLIEHFSGDIPPHLRAASKLFAVAAASVSVYFLVDKVLHTFVTPVPLEAQGNVWVPQSPNSEFVMPSVAKRNNKGELYNTLSHSVYELHVNSSLGKQRVYSFQVVDTWQCTVGHAFPLGTGPWQCVALYGHVDTPMKPQRCFTLTEANIRRLPNDIVIFSSPSVLPRKNLYKYLPKKVDKAGREVLIFDPQLSDFGTGNTTHYKELVYGDVKGLMFDGFRSDRIPVKGDCGSLIVAKQPLGNYITGMHVAGSPNGLNPRMVSTPLSQEIFDPYIGESTVRYLEATTTGLIHQGSQASGKLGKSHPTKGVQHWAKSNGIVLGSYPHRIQPSSHTQKSKICDDVVEAFGIENNLVAPLMAPEQVDGKWLNPFTIAAEQQGSLSPHFIDETVELCVKSYISDMMTQKDWLQDVGTVDVRTAINGIHGDSYVNLLPMSTSGGFFFPGCKRKYFDLLKDDDGIEYYMPKSDVQTMIDDIENRYALGERADILFNGTLKDEPVKKSKRESGATRVFTACDVAFSIVVRKQYLKVVRAFMTNNFTTECAVSMNPYSTDWDDIGKFVSQFGGDRTIAGDYSTFDKAMTPPFISGAFTVLDALRGKLSPRDERISIGIRTDVCFPITNMNGDLIQFFGGNSSGHPLTVIINSIANSIYVRHSWHDLGYDLKEFRQKVHLMTLGDDNLMESSEDGFNHTTLASSLAAHGVKYTMADKDAESVPFLKLTDCDFLKRSFVDYNGRWIAPLKMSSIFKSLCMYTEKRGGISHEEQLAQSYLQARREWSLHGRTVFYECTAKMQLIWQHYPEVENFFIAQHSYSYDKTLRWTLGIDDELDG